MPNGEGKEAIEEPKKKGKRKSEKKKGTRFAKPRFTNQQGGKETTE